MQDNPSVTMTHSLQSAGEPDMVGPGGVGDVFDASLVGVAVVVS